jgi:hypothetical protein
MNRDNSYLKGNKFAAGAGPNSTSFAPGQEPWNKGTRGWSRANKTSFQRGHRRKGTLAVGDTTFRRDKNGILRRWIKVANGPVAQFNWQPYATWLWEQANGPIPKGWIVHHADGNALHDSLSNFELVTRARHIELHRQQLQGAKLNKHHEIKGNSNEVIRAAGAREARPD